MNPCPNECTEGREYVRVGYIYGGEDLWRWRECEECNGLGEVKEDTDERSRLGRERADTLNDEKWIEDRLAELALEVRTDEELAEDVEALEDVLSLDFIAELADHLRLSTPSPREPTYLCQGCGYVTDKSKAWVEVHPCPECGKEHYWTGSWDRLEESGKAEGISAIRGVVLAAIGKAPHSPEFV
ncbi:hypothetical protein LCGC14_1736360, partial [marine sediment metagenome]